MGWLSGYTYRKPITASRPSGSVTNYPLPLLVGRGSAVSMKSVKYPTYAATVSQAPYDDDTWVSPTNVYTDNGTNSSITASTFDTNDYSYVLKTSAYKFQIPPSSVIKGIKVEIEKYRANGTAVDGMVKLSKDYNNQVGDDKADTSTGWGTSATVATYGSSTDLWGTTWTAADINYPNFGVHFVAKSTGTDSDVYVDYIRITVYYEAPVYVGGNCQTDFDDIRFTNSDGTTKLDYWIEEITNNYNLIDDMSVITDWSCYNMGTPTTSGGIMSFTTTSADPYMQKTSGLSIPQWAWIITIRMKVAVGGGTDAQIFWTNELSSWSETYSQHFTITADGEFHTYTIDLSNIASWRGTCTGFRLDPCTANGIACQIDYIEAASDDYFCRLWVELDSIGTSDTTFYMYYGNSEATSESSGTNTFSNFDDFETGNDGDTLAGVVWQSAEHAHTSTDHAYGGTRSGKILGNATAAAAAFLKTGVSNEYELSFRMWKETAVPYFVFGHGHGGWKADVRIDTSEQVTAYPSSTVWTTVLPDTWQRMFINGLDFTAHTYNLGVGEGLTAIGLTMSNENWMDDAIIFDNAGAGTNNDVYIDNVIVRNWRSVEPTWGTWGAVEVEAGFIGQSKRIVLSSSSFTGQTKRIVIKPAGYSGQTKRSTTNTASFIGQTYREVWLSVIIARFSGQLKRIVTNPADFTGQAKRVVTNPAGYEGQTNRIVQYTTTFIGQTKRILSNLAGFIGQSKRQVISPASFTGQTQRTIVASVSFNGQTKRIVSNTAGFTGQTRRNVLNSLIFTDKTTAANNATASDINLLPSSPVVGDCLYVGSNYQFSRIYVNQSVAGEGNWATEEKYWNGSSWTTCTMVLDNISSFVGGSGTQYLEITPEEDWQTTTVNGVTAYWVRFELVSFVAMTTQPIATQIWVEKLL